ncbi:MAG: zinc ribbon domain-containing protein [Firmicutes bacterium]|nr:zinc ribbon domain-containing protein [Bacillota bacterium]
MAFFDKLANAARNVADRTNEMFEINGLNSKIGAEKTKITALKTQLGEVFWAKYQAGDILDEEAAGICGQIQAGEDAIRSLEAEIQAKKDAAEAEAKAKAAQQAQPAQQTQPDLQVLPQSDAWTCPACGSVNPVGTKFCKDCGGKAPAPAPAAAVPVCECGAAIPQGSKFCPECGKPAPAPAPETPAVLICACGAENPPGTKFCGACGSKLQ